MISTVSFASLLVILETDESHHQECWNLQIGSKICKVGARTCQVLLE